MKQLFLLVTLTALFSSCFAQEGSITMSQLLKDEKADGTRIIVVSMTEKEINQAIDVFMRSYENSVTVDPVRPVMTREDGAFLLQFPNSTPYNLFCFWVNYIVYSNKEKRYNNNVLGWYEVGADAVGVWSQFAGQRLMFFIPGSDTEFDNVYFTTEDNQCFKQEFAYRARLVKLKNSPVKYIAPIG